VDGFLNVHKPAGLTSHDVVQRIRKWSREKRVGHGGTLDPTATGVLPVALGYGTRLLEFLTGPKIYRGQIEFGTSTDSYDAAGSVLERRDTSGLSRSQVETSLAGYVGELLQQPPLFSAVKYRGKPLYYYARRGIPAVALPRRVTVSRISLLAWEPPIAVVEVECSRGTYVRSLAHDVGQSLGCGAYLKALVRVRDGMFAIEESITLSDLETAFQEQTIGAFLYPLDAPIRDWPAVTLPPSRDREVLDGKALLQDSHDVTLPEAETPGIQAPSGGGSPHCRAYSADGKLLALLEYQPENASWHPFKVFPSKPTANIL